MIEQSQNLKPTPENLSIPLPGIQNLESRNWTPEIHQTQ